MKILIATDSFKGSLTSIQAGQAIAKGIDLANINATVDFCPVADGGEGTVDGTHPNDFGFASIAKALGDLLEEELLVD